jgi:hypothetical protein
VNHNILWVSELQALEVTFSLFTESPRETVWNRPYGFK